MQETERGTVPAKEKVTGSALARASPSCSAQRVTGERSRSGLIRSVVSVNAWLARPPTVSEARPTRCTGCRAASRPAGGPLAIHGHGVRRRQLRGPLDAQGEPQIVVVEIRRYECQRCGAVMTMAPREVIARKHYAATAIGLAVALYGVAGKCARAVREAVSPWRVVGASSTGWRSLRRWISAASSMWRCVRRSPSTWSTRQRAERIATTLAAHADGEPELVQAAFLGAVHAR